MVPFDQPLPEIEHRLAAQETWARLDYLVRRIAILDAKLDRIDDSLRGIRNLP